ncbi:ABC transporter ATP-binding protein [Hathewaya massiliensis]|uniref:ABC transporter ATP-binding protein n=1 Tax=Hathewaya massiliensis TaxID=1964382 RepID=UPI00115A2DB5|nr:ABC transporter ATP-binding protein [Hathewaya massiliensis]
MIEIKGVSRIYKMGKESLSVLNNVNLTINKGEFVAIVGPSGSGKSTLMNLIGCLDKPSCGTISINGENISTFKDNKMSKFRNKEIGFVFQSFNLESTLTALENVMLPLMFAGISTKERKKLATEALNAVGLGDRLNHKPTEMSGGQRQRVSIARALVNKPNIILADEPTGNLDTKTGHTIMNLLGDLNKQGYTIIMVTHNPEDAAKAKRIIKIRDGVIEGEEINHEI